MREWNEVYLLRVGASASFLWARKWPCEFPKREVTHFLASRDTIFAFQEILHHGVTASLIPKISCSRIMARAFGAASTEITPRPATLHCGCPLDQRGSLDLHNACSRTVFPSELFALSRWHIHHGADYSARICSFVKSHSHIYHRRLSCRCTTGVPDLHNL